MKVGANQVTFLPWVGYWHRLVSADVYVDMLDTQYEKGDYYNRVMVNCQWMTLPVHVKTGARFKDVTFDTKALKKIAKRVFQSYRREPYCKRIDPIVGLLEYWSGDNLLNLNLALRGRLAATLGISLAHVLESTEIGGDETESRLWGMLKKTVPDMTHYLSGASGRSYLLSAPPVPTMYQKIVKPYGGNSILQLIAQEPDMTAAVMAAGLWEA